LIVTDPLNHMSLMPRGFPWPSLSKMIPADALPLSLGTDETAKIPVVHVGPAVIESLFGSVDSLKAIQRSIDGGLKPSRYSVDAVVTVKTSTVVQDLSARNVVGVVEGSDPSLRNEVVVIGAHYDHIGFMKTHAAGEDYIYNGADDNASGTAGVMAIASAFHASAQPPRRTVLFIFFAGEEEGLFGSQAYTEHPLFPLDRSVAMINLDMIGRGPLDTLYVVGTSRSPDLVTLNEEENRAINFTLVYGQEQFLGRSDQANFLRKGVPALYLHTGEHADYHKVTDEASRINFEKAARIARLTFLDAWRIANESAHYKVIDKPISLF
jgi:Iap family predicted aminopeptidase